MLRDRISSCRGRRSIREELTREVASGGLGVWFSVCGVGNRQDGVTMDQLKEIVPTERVSFQILKCQKLQLKLKKGNYRITACALYLLVCAMSM